MLQSPSLLKDSRLKDVQKRGQVAQLVEQRIENPCVGGSIPPLATIPPPGNLNPLAEDPATQSLPKWPDVKAAGRNWLN